jgi:nucleotide-binding universal stress UspA family protein
MPLVSVHRPAGPQQRHVERDWPGRAPTPTKKPTVVLATSGSRSSQEATIYAAELAASVNAPLSIVHVLPAIEYRVGRLAPMRAVARRACDPFASDILCHARELAWRHGSAATLQLLAGDTARMIVQAATDARADLLVLSTPRTRRWPGRTSLARGWIEHHAPCPITTPASRIPADLP